MEEKNVDAMVISERERVCLDLHAKWALSLRYSKWEWLWVCKSIWNSGDYKYQVY